MEITIIALSGAIGSGKSTLAKKLAENGAMHIKTNSLIRLLKPATENNRQAMQAAGDGLDRSTSGAWVAQALGETLREAGATGRQVVALDSVRIERQLVELRKTFGTSLVHIHLTASGAELARRFQARGSPIDENTTFDQARENPTEHKIEDLAPLADAVIHTDRCSHSDVYVRVIARLGRRASIAPPLVDILIGGQYGSEGKGNIAAYLAPEYDVLVRVGGPNAGHKVFREGYEPITFHQLPSGSFHNKFAKLVIGAGAVIRLPVLQKEMHDVSIPFSRLIVDPQAMVIEDEDIAWETANLKEAIGSTAQGVGRATARKILDRRPDSGIRLAKDVPELKEAIEDSIGYLEDAYCSKKLVMLEGTQGTSLSIHHGHYPHVTSRITTASGCAAEAGIAPAHIRRIIMVCRTYPIRVGDTDAGNTSGYMSQEITKEELASRSGLEVSELEKTERTSTTGRPRRIAEFDWSQLQRSAILNGPTDIALTFVDYIDKMNRAAYRYEQMTSDTLRFIEEIEKVVGVPVSLMSTRFGARNIIDRRTWAQIRES